MQRSPIFTKLFSGFTVTGGHGISRGPDPIHRIGGAFFIENSKPIISSNIISGNQAGGSSAIAAEYSNPVISGNIIFGNRQFGAIIGLYVCSGDTPAIIEANNVGANFELPGDPEWCCSQHIGISYSDAIIRSNYIHDHFGFEAIGLQIRNSKVELFGNVFENLHFRECPLAEPQRCKIVEIRRSDVRVLNNTFRNCSTFNFCCLILSEADIYGPTPIVSGNVFENIVGPDGGGYGGAGILVLNCDALVSRNRFTNCAYGAIGISIWTQFPSCSVFVNENEFMGNDYDDLGQSVHQASAVGIATDGTGKAILTGNSFLDNQKIAVDLLYYGSDSLTYYMDAENNFWGDSTGPYHPTLNPTGQGDTIAGRVDFDPWLTENDIDNDNSPSSAIPQTFALLDPYPNPFNPGVTLPLSVTRPGVFKVEIFDLLGRLIWSNKERCSTGTYRIYWPGVDANGQTVAAGIYFARASSGTQITPARKLVLLK